MCEGRWWHHESVCDDFHSWDTKECVGGRERETQRERGKRRPVGLLISLWSSCLMFQTQSRRRRSRRWRSVRQMCVLVVGVVAFTQGKCEGSVWCMVQSHQQVRTHSQSTFLSVKCSWIKRRVHGAVSLILGIRRLLSLLLCEKKR